MYSTLCVVLPPAAQAQSAAVSGLAPTCLRANVRIIAEKFLQSYALEAMRVKARIFWQGPVDDHTHESDVQNGMPQIRDRSLSSRSHAAKTQLKLITVITSGVQAFTPG